MTPEERAEEVCKAYGMICLNGPNGGVSCHEYTLCDCQVKDVIAAAIREAVEAEREACLDICHAQEAIFSSNSYATGQPLSSANERFACAQIAEAIRQRGEG